MPTYVVRNLVPLSANSLNIRAPEMFRPRCSGGFRVKTKTQQGRVLPRPARDTGYSSNLPGITTQKLRRQKAQPKKPVSVSALLPAETTDGCEVYLLSGRGSRRTTSASTSFTLQTRVQKIDVGYFPAGCLELLQQEDKYGTTAAAEKLSTLHDRLLRWKECHVPPVHSLPSIRVSNKSIQEDVPVDCSNATTLALSGYTI